MVGFEPATQKKHGPGDDAMYNEIEGLLQTQATLCRFLY